MTQREVVILSGVRTAIGDFGGGLKDKPPCHLSGEIYHLPRKTPRCQALSADGVCHI